MNFLELTHKRYSVRSYKSKPVSRENIDCCIEAARIAPSACNCQPWKFVVVDKPELKNEIAKAAFSKLLNINSFVFQAPAIVIIVSQRQNLSAKFGSIIKHKNFSQMDIGITAEHFCLQAAELGLGTCMLGWFDEKKVKKILSIPKSKRIELMISVGYPVDEKIPNKKRKSTNEILSYNKY